MTRNIGRKKALWGGLNQGGKRRASLQGVWTQTFRSTKGMASHWRFFFASQRHRQKRVPLLARQLTVEAFLPQADIL